MTLNVLVVSVIGRFSVTRKKTSVYNILFVNLAVTNALTSILLWFANNLLFLFHDAMMKLSHRNSCAFMVSLAAVLFISLAFGDLHTLSIYLLICSFTYLLIYLITALFIYLFTYLFVCLHIFLYLFVHLFIHLNRS